MKKLRKIQDKESKITSEDIENCTDEKELLSMKATIEMNMVDIKGKIDTAQGRAASNGVFSDPDWWARANSYKRVLGFLHQRIAFRQRELKELISEKSVGSFFMKAAKNELDPSLYERLLATAHELKKEANEFSNAEKE